MKKEANQIGTGRRDAMKMIMARSAAGILGFFIGPLAKEGTHDSFSCSPNSGNEVNSRLKITKIWYYGAPGYTKPLFNQARGIVEIETDGGIAGTGEGRSKDMYAKKFTFLSLLN